MLLIESIYTKLLTHPDIIVVDSLAFKRYCDIAVLLSKKTVIVTDNDGDIQKNIQEKYADYLDKDYLVFIYEHDKTLNTIEPSVLKVNCIDAKPTEAFKKAISKNNSMMDKSIGEIMSFMENNKTEWAFRVFDSTTPIVYPRYIHDALQQFD